MSDTTFTLFPISKTQYTSKELEGIENGRNLLQYKLIFYIGAAFVSLFTLVSFFKGRIELGLFLSGCLLLVSLVHLYVCKTNKVSLAVFIYTLVMSLLILYLVVTGGVSGTGPLWSYPIVVLLIPMLGYLKGAIFSATLIIVITLVLMLLPQDSFLYVYDNEFKLRYLGTLSALSLLSCAIEFSRGRAFSYMLFLSNELEYVSRTDPLTGLMNRRGIEDLFKKEVNRFERKGTVFSILLIDVDDFKKINDEHGHTLGDAVLKELAQILLRNLRHMDTVSRWGGEEFLILLPDTGSDQAQLVGEKLCRFVEKTSPLCDGLDHKTTISIGVASYTSEMEILSLADRADKALYQAKENGKNQVINAANVKMTAA